MKSKTLIEKQLRKKTSSELVETLIAAKKAKGWQEIAGLLSTPNRKRASVNVSKLNTSEGKVLIPGKVLSQGDLTKKLDVVALNFSEKAKEKILKSGGKIITMLEEIKSNPEAKGLTIIK